MQGKFKAVLKDVWFDSLGKDEANKIRDLLVAGTPPDKVLSAYLLVENEPEWQSVFASRSPVRAATVRLTKVSISKGALRVVLECEFECSLAQGLVDVAAVEQAIESCEDWTMIPSVYLDLPSLGALGVGEVEEDAAFPGSVGETSLRVLSVAA